MLGGVIDWTALPYICEMYGVTDLDLLLHDLVWIRDWQIEQRNNDAEY